MAMYVIKDTVWLHIAKASLPYENDKNSRYISIRVYLCNVLCNALSNVKLFIKQPDYSAVAKTKIVPVFYGNVCH